MEFQHNKVYTTKKINHNARCQNCYRNGHWTYECNNKPIYLPITSRTESLRNPNLTKKPINLDDIPETPHVTDWDYKRDIYLKKKESKSGKHKQSGGDKIFKTLDNC